LIILIIFGEEYKLCSSSLCNFIPLGSTSCRPRRFQASDEKTTNNNSKFPSKSTNYMFVFFIWWGGT
jgi:hypothetical protein